MHLQQTNLDAKKASEKVREWWLHGTKKRRDYETGRQEHSEGIESVGKRSQGQGSGLRM